MLSFILFSNFLSLLPFFFLSSLTIPILATTTTVTIGQSLPVTTPPHLASLSFSICFFTLSFFLSSYHFSLFFRLSLHLHYHTNCCHHFPYSGLHSRNVVILSLIFILYLFIYFISIVVVLVIKLMLV